jgi:hypothetical protein
VIDRGDADDAIELGVRERHLAHITRPRLDTIGHAGDPRVGEEPLGRVVVDPEVALIDVERRHGCLWPRQQQADGGAARAGTDVEHPSGSGSPGTA